MGSNMAEAHPVGFQWVIEAKARGAKVIHIDPRFTRTSAPRRHLRAAPRRQRHRLPRRRRSTTSSATTRTSASTSPPYTNALVHRQREVPATPTTSTGCSPATTPTRPRTTPAPGSTRASRQRRRRRSAGHRARQGDSPSGLQHESGGPKLEGPAHDPARTRPCSTRAASSRSSSGTSPATPPRWSRRSAASRGSSSCRSARTGRRTRAGSAPTAVVYAVGWTQHTVGVQYIRAAAIIQLLLGNMGRPGGGIMAMRGHASIQGSTDIPTLFNILPGYMPMPSAAHAHEPREYLDSFIGDKQKGFWRNADAYFDLADEGVLGRRRDGGERLLLRLPAAADRRPRHVPHHDGHDRRQGQRLLPARPEPGRRLRRTAGCSGWRWPTSTGSSSATWP